MTCGWESSKDLYIQLVDIQYSSTDSPLSCAASTARSNTAGQQDLHTALQHGHIDPDVISALERSHITTKEALLVRQ